MRGRITPKIHGKYNSETFKGSILIRGKGKNDLQRFVADSFTSNFPPKKLNFRKLLKSELLC